MYDFDAEWLQKLEKMRENGREPYPNGFTVTHLSTALHKQYADVEDPRAEGEVVVSVAGRVRFRNRMGKLIFLRVQDRGEQNVPGVDREGNEILRGGIIQIMVRKNDVGDEIFDELKGLDIGDFVWIEGVVMRTKTKELTIVAKKAAFAGKILQSFPDRFHGLSDIETRSRMRYVDLFMNESTRHTFRTRSRVVRFIRDYFHDLDFMEVETPIMQVIPGGANARPFVTHHNTLDLPLFLRVAPELYLKRLVVGGFERVFEINRSFRNEGISTRHNPEFTMLEFYQAWSTYEDLMTLTEDLIEKLVKKLFGESTIHFSGHTIEFAAPWRRADMDLLVTERTSLTLEQMQSVAAMRDFWLEHHEVKDPQSLPTIRGKWWEKLFEEYVEPHLINPTFVTGFPTEISPLSRRNDDQPDRVDRFELFCATWELANGFSELNDPVDQANRFAEQAKAKDEGDDESMYFDADYIRALTYGMPPTAGQGIGIDRLVMLLTGCSSIRDVILFPTLRPEKAAE